VTKPSDHGYNSPIRIKYREKTMMIRKIYICAGLTFSMILAGEAQSSSYIKVLPSCQVSHVTNSASGLVRTTKDLYKTYDKTAILYILCMPHGELNKAEYLQSFYNHHLRLSHLSKIMPGYNEDLFEHVVLVPQRDPELETLLAQTRHLSGFSVVVGPRDVMEELEFKPDVTSYAVFHRGFLEGVHEIDQYYTFNHH
jgi:hypothetical protein